MLLGNAGMYTWGGWVVVVVAGRYIDWGRKLLAEGTPGRGIMSSSGSGVVGLGFGGLVLLRFKNVGNPCSSKPPE